jgi:hypothetical protein
VKPNIKQSKGHIPLASEAINAAQNKYRTPTRKRHYHSVSHNSAEAQMMSFFLALDVGKNCRRN